MSGGAAQPPELVGAGGGEAAAAAEALAVRAVIDQLVAGTAAAGTEEAQGQGHEHVSEAGLPAAELPMLVAAVQKEARSSSHLPALRWLPVQA